MGCDPYPGTYKLLPPYRLALEPPPALDNRLRSIAEAMFLYIAAPNVALMSLLPPLTYELANSPYLNGIFGSRYLPL